MLTKLVALGFDFFQVHYDPAETPGATLEHWAEEVGSERLWLAPRLPPGTVFPPEALEAAETLLVGHVSARHVWRVGADGGLAAFQGAGRAESAAPVGAVGEGCGRRTSARRCR